MTSPTRCICEHDATAHGTQDTWEDGHGGWVLALGGCQWCECDGFSAMSAAADA